MEMIVDYIEPTSRSKITTSLSNKLRVYEIDPLTDPRWPELLSRHPQASIFHTCEWLKALQKTYGYKPIAFTTSQNENLADAIVFCEVRSWLTGQRLVSIPFSDHCQPLAEGDRLNAILRYLQVYCGKNRLRYVELRPMPLTPGFEQNTYFANSESFSFQKIDLRPDAESLYGNFHDSCIRRKIKRAGRENLQYEHGRSEKLLRKFRHLLLLTRRRHKLPPQPASWFENLAKCLGEKITFHLLSKDEIPVASIVTLMYKDSIIYKYGCSDSQFNNMGGTPLLFWKVIQQAKADGAKEFDLGRSGYEDPGLIAFKEHLGAASTELRYYRTPVPRSKNKSDKTETSIVRTTLSRLPDQLLSGVGEIFYRHMG